MKPKFLQTNAQIAIVAPSGRVFKEELDANLEFLKSLGYQAVFGKNLFESYFEGYYYAGTIEQRLADFQWALDNPDIQAIWCARGGYGAVHLLDQLDWTHFQQHPKWLIGYSDITALHNHINNLRIATIHGITIKRLNCDYTSESFDSLKKVLAGEKLNYQIPHHPYNRQGQASGRLVGGNLSLIYSLSGSRFAIQGEDIILFIEDWNENWYHLDRMMMNLKNSGLLHRIKGMLVGSFTQMDVKEENPKFYDEYDDWSYRIILKFMEDYKIPLGFGFPAGHIGDNRALTLGSSIKMEVNEQNLQIEFQ